MSGCECPGTVRSLLQSLFDMEPSYNPAAVGKQSQLNVTAAYALDLAGFEHNPQTAYIGADLPFMPFVSIREPVLSSSMTRSAFLLIRSWHYSMLCKRNCSVDNCDSVYRQDSSRRVLMARSLIWTTVVIRRFPLLMLMAVRSILASVFIILTGNGMSDCQAST